MSSFFSKLFARKNKKVNIVETIIRTPECEEIYALHDQLDLLCQKKHYVARSEYSGLAEKYQKSIEYFSVLEESKMLDTFCTQNHMSASIVRETIKTYNSLNETIDQLNDQYIAEQLIQEKAYLDDILTPIDKNIKLDEDQRRVVLTDEDYCLVIAGAGAGKTTTVAAKVKYLVDKKHIDPKDILVISFTNKAVGELREKINKDLNIDCPIATFHSTGNAILHIHNPEPLNIMDNSKLYFILQDYFRESVLKNERMVNNLIMFFASYFDAPYKGEDLNKFFNQIAKSNFTTMRSELDEYKKEVIDARSKKNVTIQNEIVRSFQEVEIANFLYLNNLDYEYEPLYPYKIDYARKPYTPDFVIKQGDKLVYLEHFGITEDGQNSMYTPEEIERYKQNVNNKIMFHRQHGTNLIYTFSEYKDKKPLMEHLKALLETEGFVLNPRPNKEIMEKIVYSEESRYIRKLISLICRFISNFKTNGYGVDEFNRMYHSTTNVRSRLFLNICQECFLVYQKFLKENNAVDFEDMINESARILREVKEMEQRLHFKYIIVDEYQDISRQRFDLTTALSEVTDAKIIAVGDDWQSIYAFSGSDISLFTKFEEKMGYAKMLKIVRTYRNSQDVIDIAGNFIQKNPEQIQKRLLSHKNIKDPVIIYTYDTTYKDANQDRRSGVLYATAHAVEVALEQIIKFSKEEGKKTPGSILLLGRYAFDGDHLERSGLFEYKTRGQKLKSVKYPHLDITFMTVHMSKGLGYDNVIVVNGRNETYGFPSKIQDDPVLSFVIKGDNSIDYAEERRLFYVAMTRTKNRVYFIAPEQNPSEFLLEIKHDYKNVVLKGNWNEEEIKRNISRKPCPICGFPLQLRYKNAYGLRLYICTNEPEICGFMTNDVKAGKLSIMKCEKCVDGYLVIKPGNADGYFLGCTNYKPNKTGCNKSISKKAYYEMNGYEMEKEDIQPVERIVYTKKSSDKPASNSKPDGVTKVTDKVFENIEKVPAITAKGTRDYVEITKAQVGSIMFGNYDLNEAVFTVLNALQNLSSYRYYGVTVLTDILKGKQSDKVKANKLMGVPEFGAFKDMSYERVRCIIEWMIAEHYILKTKEKYPVLHSTYEGLHYSETMTDNKLKKLKKYLEEDVVTWNM